MLTPLAAVTSVVGVPGSVCELLDEDEPSPQPTSKVSRQRGPKKELRFFELNMFDFYPDFFDKYLFLKENKRYVIVTHSIQIQWSACQCNHAGGLIGAVSNIDVRGLKSVRMTKISKKLAIL